MIEIDIDGILDKTLEILKAEPTLAAVTGWHKVNGIIPGYKMFISASCDEETYEQYTKDMDKARAKFKVYATLDSRELAGGERRKDEDRLESGERAIRRMARIVRQVLMDNVSLGGSVPASFPGKIEYLSSEEHKDLHIAVISFEVSFFASRKRRPAPTVNEIDAIFMDERKIVLKGEG